MTGAEILAVVTGAYDMVKSIGMGIIEYVSKGRVDQTELARMKHDYEMATQNLDFSLKQAGLWLQEKLIALEQATGAKWRTPLILISGMALILVAINNILAYVYFSWAKPISMGSPEMIVLAGMFVLLVTGDVALLLSAFKKQNQPTTPEEPVMKAKGG
ncbi:MAG: hypothetical protein WC551_12510 [Patescibacteria group bacterium]